MQQYADQATVQAEQQAASSRQAAAITPGSQPWDVIVVGSGAAGGMAAFQLATAGVKVLLLEAGRLLDPAKEYRTMEWPYQSERRGRLPVDEHALDAAEYNMLDRPYGTTPQLAAFKKVMAYSGNHFTRNWIADEKQNPLTGTPYAWVRARVLGGKTNLWGRVSLRFSEQDLKGKSFDGFGEDWPIGYADIAPYYDRVDRLLGMSGTKENLPQLPDGIYQRGVKLTCGEMTLKNAIAKMGRHLIPGRCGVTTEGVANKYRARCAGRGRCGRGCDLQAPMHSPTALIFPARDTGNLTVRPNSTVAEVLVDTNTGKASGVRVIDSVDQREPELHRQGRRPRRVVPRVDAPAAAVEVGAAPERPRQLVGRRRPLLLRAHHGPARRSATCRRCKGTPPTNDDGRPVRAPTSRGSATSPSATRASCAATASRAAAAAPSIPTTRTPRRASAPAFKKTVRDLNPTPISISAASARCWPARENRVALDPAVKDAWGIPVLRFDYTFGENELAMAKDMAETAGEMLEAAGAEDRSRVTKDVLTEGWSIHEMGTARMGTDPKTSVTNSFGQAHDVKNLFVVDGSTSCRRRARTRPG